MIRGTLGAKRANCFSGRTDNVTVDVSSHLRIPMCKYIVLLPMPMNIPLSRERVRGRHDEGDTST